MVTRTVDALPPSHGPFLPAIFFFARVPANYSTLLVFCQATAFLVSSSTIMPWCEAQVRCGGCFAFESVCWQLCNLASFWLQNLPNRRSQHVHLVRQHYSQILPSVAKGYSWSKCQICSSTFWQFEVFPHSSFSVGFWIVPLTEICKKKKPN